MNTAIPSYLKVGDVIAIVATAKFIDEQAISNAIAIFKSWGLEVYIHPDLLTKENQFAGSDQLRAKVLQDLINNPSIKAIIGARGGYGTTRMIDLVDFSSLKLSPKWIIGFSDLTALHLRLNQLKICSLHSIMPILFENELAKNSIVSLKKTLFGEIENFKISPHILNILGQTNAELVGGNLSIISHLMGTVDEIETDNKILFIEDLDEYLYHIDRMMVQLKRAGKLKNLVGLIVGHMTNMKDNDIPFGKNVEEIILGHVSEYGYPVCFGFPVGHDFDNMTLISGGNYSFNVTEKEVILSLN